MNAEGDTITWTLSGCPADSFDVGFVYALASGQRSMGLAVNGVQQAPISFPAVLHRSAKLATVETSDLKTNS